MKNKFEQPVVAIQEEATPEESQIGDFKSFMEGLKENMAEVTPEEVSGILTELERYSQTPDRKIEVYTDPNLETFCCGLVPSKRVTPEGEIVDDPNKKTYLIGAPFIFVAGQAPLDFMRGEMIHETGHAKWTDFGRMKRFESLAKSEGYDPSELLALNNCIEDPRMERLVGGPLHKNEREQLLAKNGQMIIPNIAEGIREGQMSPTDQFKFIVKLERIWALHEKDLSEEEKPWSLDDLHPRVREEFEKIEPELAKITGDAKTPAMKVNAEVEELIVEHIWSAHKRLIDEFLDKGNNGRGKGKQGGKRGEPSKGELPQEDPPNLDPNDPSTWPPELQKIFQKMKKDHEERLEEEAEKNKEEAEQRDKDKDRIDKEKHELQKTRDGFDSPEMREKYNHLKSEVAPAISQLKRIFQRFLPKVDEPQYAWNKKGIRFDTKRYVRRIGTGHEQPMGRRRTPEKNALVLQVLVDVSGSMYDGERIQNAVKACIAICEASQDHNVTIEILANDDKNLEDDPNYIIKTFKEKYGGKEKSNVVAMLDKFGGSNEDASAIRVALPRLKKQAQKMRTQVDRLKSLMVYISDSTTESEDTKKATEEARKSTPFEGTAITAEGDIPEKVKYHFGPDSIIPKSVDEFPSAIQEILSRHISGLKPRE